LIKVILNKINFIEVSYVTINFNELIESNTNLEDYYQYLG